MPPVRGLVAVPAMLIFASISAACGSGGGSGAAANGTASAAASAAASGTAEAPGVALQGSGECAALVAKWSAEPSLPGAPQFEANRVELLGRPRGTPLLWRRAPEMDKDAPAAARSAVEKLQKAARPIPLVRGLVRRYARSPEVLRSIVLREGYVFSDAPDVAVAVVQGVKLTHLFREPTIYLLRGHTVHTLTRAPKTRLRPERYVHADGPFKGDIAELILGDRVGVERADVEKAPIALDLAGAGVEDGFDRVRVKHVSESGVVAEVHYPDGPWITAALASNGAELKVACVDGPPDALAARKKALDASAGMRAAMAKIGAVVREEVQEAPMFDEPKDEPDDEQQDGSLRREWRRAYEQGLRHFGVGNVKYDVYDELGRPIPPQVCVDFITDTFERASGTWYAPLPPAPEGDRPKPAPQRISGKIDLGKQDLDNRRSVAELVAFAKRHPEMFDVLDLPQEERIPFTKRRELFAYLAEHESQFAPGDVLVIHGPGNDGKPHYHSVILMEQDPITGVPVRVAGNASVPREQTLSGVMSRSPKRSIKHRIRPRPEWLVPALTDAVRPPTPG